MRGRGKDAVAALEERALRAIERNGMLDRGDRVVAAVSGGPDSVAMLLFLARISGGLSLDLRAWHLDHMIRGAESAADARFVEELSESLGLPCASEAVDVPAVMKGTGSSPQEAARAARLGRLAEFADSVGADRVALGHTADDQVETFLMRVVQGAGLTGFSGIRPVSGRVIRPLIDARRGEVEAYCRALGVEPRVDSSNEGTAYLRNRVRLRLLPFLEDEFGTGVREVILREVEAVSCDNDYLARQVGAAYERLARECEREGGDPVEVRVDVRGLGDLDASLARGVVRRAWSAIMPGATNPGWQLTLDILEKVAGGASGAGLDLPRGASVAREYGDLVFMAPGPARPPAAAGAVPLPVPGTARLEGTGLLVTARQVPAEEIRFDRDPAREFVRCDLEAPLEVRAPREGDSFRPLGSPGAKRLSDFFTDEKVPRGSRAACPLVVCAGKIAWVAGHRLDGRFAVPAGAAGAIRLRLVREGEYDWAAPGPAGEL